MAPDPPTCTGPTALVDELLDFALRHPTRPLDRQSARWMIEQLGMRSNHLLDLADSEGRQLVATLFAGMDNPDGAAELWVLGFRQGARGPEMLTRALAWAEGIAAAAGARYLEISLPGPLAGCEPTVCGAGYELTYRLLTMGLDAIEGCDALQSPPPEGCSWASLDAHNAVSAHDCYRQAFATTSGAQVPSLDTFRATMLQAARRPRVLLDGGRVIAYARVVWLDEPARHGEVRLIARHPNAPQSGLGKATLAEALRELVRMGATGASLEVASDNERAIGLYRRFGFATREQTAVYRRGLSETARGPEGPAGS